MNRNCSHKLRCLNAWFTGSGIIKKYTLVVLGVALVKKVTLGVGFEESYAQVTLSVKHSLILLLANQDVELSALSPGQCLTACQRISIHDDNILNL